MRVMKTRGKPVFWRQRAPAKNKCYRSPIGADGVRPLQRISKTNPSLPNKGRKHCAPAKKKCYRSSAGTGGVRPETIVIQPGELWHWRNLPGIPGQVFRQMGGPILIGMCPFRLQPDERHFILFQQFRKTKRGCVVGIQPPAVHI